jgi:hypothetical protein
MRKNNRIDVQAFILAVLFTIAMDVVVAMWFGIRPSDISRLGLFGPPMFVGMCAIGAGVPMYMSIRFVRLWRNRRT